MDLLFSLFCVHGIENASLLLERRLLVQHYTVCEGRDSAVGIATRYRLDGPGDRIPVGVRFSAHVQTGPGAHQPSIQWTLGLSRR